MAAAGAAEYDCETVIASVRALVGAHGLICRGGSDFGPREDAPRLPGGGEARAVLLIGSAGAGYWPHFSRWRAGLAQPVSDPLDTWARQIVEAAAARVDAHAVSPSDQPYLPFQRWAMRAEALRPSPLGVLMHPEFGLWHAYRGALLFDRRLGFAPAAVPRHACDDCLEKPCLQACPVGAHGRDGFDHAGCLSWLGGGSGGECAAYGCRDRNACPVGERHRYPLAAQAFHMRAFGGV